MYVCNAGTSWNRFESDFNKNNFTLTCQENNTFSEEPNVSWPTCVNGNDLTIKWLASITKVSCLDIQCTNLLDLQTTEIIYETPVSSRKYSETLR